MTSNMLLHLATTNCGGLWPQKSKVITVGYPTNGQLTVTMQAEHGKFVQRPNTLLAGFVQPKKNKEYKSLILLYNLRFLG